MGLVRFTSLLVVGLRALVSCQVALYIRVIIQEEPDRECKQTKATIFYNLIMKVTSHHFCYSYKQVTNSNRHTRADGDGGN